MAVLKAIWIKRMKRGPMDPVERADLITGCGIVGNADQGGRRQVTVIEAGAWSAATASLGVELDPSTRRANLMVTGISLANCRGRVLAVGNCLIRIYGETKPCERMDQAHFGLKQALARDWGGGAYGEVLQGGTINLEDEVAFLPETESGETSLFEKLKNKVLP